MDRNNKGLRFRGNLILRKIDGFETKLLKMFSFTSISSTTVFDWSRFNPNHRLSQSGVKLKTVDIVAPGSLACSRETGRFSINVCLHGKRSPAFLALSFP